MINVNELIGDRDFTQPGGVNFIRRPCEIVDHEPVVTEIPMNYPGIITIAQDRSIKMEPSADVSEEEIHVYTTLPLYTTGAVDDVTIENGYLSDIVVWQNTKYRVMSCKDNTQYGYSRSRAVKLEQGVQ